MDNYKILSAEIIDNSLAIRTYNNGIIVLEKKDCAFLGRKISELLDLPETIIAQFNEIEVYGD